MKPSIVCISEACTNSSISDAFLTLDNYVLTVRADGTDTKDCWCRGLLMFMRADISAAKLESNLIVNMVQCEGLTIPWDGKGQVLSLALAYRPPRPPGSVADKGFSDKFCDLYGSSETEKRVFDSV